MVKTPKRRTFVIIVTCVMMSYSIATQADFLTNGSFEADKNGWAQWQLEPNVVISIINNAGQAKDGVKFAEVSFANTATYITFNQDITIASSALNALLNGAPLKFSAWYRADVATNETPRLACVYDPDGAAHGWSDNGGIAGDQPSWTQQSLGFVFDKASSTLRVLLNVNESTLHGAAGKVWWDGARLEVDSSYNYLPNPSFEDDKNGWGQWEPEPIVVVSVINDPGQAHHGNKFIKMEFQGNALFSTFNSDISLAGTGLGSLPNNSPIKFSTWYKADVSGPDSIRLAAVYDPDSNPHGWGDNGGIAGDQPTWTLQTHTLSLDSAATNLRVLLNVNETTISGPGTVWWDDCKVQLNTDKEYVTNGSFENGKLGWQQWAPEPNVVVTIPDDPAGAKHGNKYAQVHYLGSTTFATWNQDINLAASGLIDFVTGTPLYLTAWYKADVAGEEVGRLYHFYDVVSNPRGYGNAGLAGDVSVWTQQVLPFTMDSTASDLRILLNVDETTITGDGTVWWDDVRISLTAPEGPTPTPTQPPSGVRNWTYY